MNHTERIEPKNKYYLAEKVPYYYGEVRTAYILD